MKFKLPIIVGVLLAASPLWAHHGSAGFDPKKPVHLTGRVSTVDWTNPHVVIHLDVTGPDGQEAMWLVNTLPPNAAARQGFPKTSFAAGTELSIDSYQATDGSNSVNGTSIAFADGKKIVTAACFADEPYCYKPNNRVQ